MAVCVLDRSIYHTGLYRGTVLDIRSSRSLWTVGRFVPLLLTPAVLLASTFPGEFRVPASYWVLAMAAAALFVVTDRWPLPVSVAMSAMALAMFSIETWGLARLTPFLGAIVLVWVIARCDRTAALTATGCWAVAAFVGNWGGHATAFWQPAALLESGTYVALPVLLGLVLRSQRELAESLEQQAAETAQRTRADERAALARELHDVVAHHMASIVLRVNVARHTGLSDDPAVHAVLDDVHDTAGGALADIRRVLSALRDPEFSDIAILEPAEAAEQIQTAILRARAAGFNVEADVDADLDGLDAVSRLTLLRLVQESLTNVMKHADPAERVRVLLRTNDSVVRLRISSGGRAPTDGKGHGVVGMRERVLLAGGTLSAHAADGGWLVIAEFPSTAALSAAQP